MDPLSLSASILAVLGAAGRTSQALEQILGLRHAPAELLALMNEVRFTGHTCRLFLLRAHSYTRFMFDLLPDDPRAACSETYHCIC